MNPVLQAIVSASVAATAASRGWIVEVQGDDLRVVAAAGEGAGDLLEARASAGSGAAGFVVSSGQPMAIVPHGDDPRMTEGITSLLGVRPASILCVPCGGEDAVLGAMELVDKAGGGPFSFDDVELATLLAGIAGAALEASGPGVSARPPAEISGELARLASSDPASYARVAFVVEALLARG